MALVDREWESCELVDILVDITFSSGSARKIIVGPKLDKILWCLDDKLKVRLVIAGGTQPDTCRYLINRSAKPKRAPISS